MAIIKPKKRKAELPSYGDSEHLPSNLDLTEENLPEFESLPSLGTPNLRESPQPVHEINNSQTEDLPEYESKSELDIPMRKSKFRSNIASLPQNYAMGGKPLFVKVDDYQKAIELIDHIREKLQSAEKTLALIEKVKADENAEIDRWHRNIDQIKDNLILIDRILSGY